jgi:hypothetical protein
MSSATGRRGRWSGGLILTQIWVVALVDAAALFRGLTSILFLWLIPCCCAARNGGWVDARFLCIVEAPENGGAA